MITKKRHIDLHLPKSWNQCTTEELEIIAAALLAEQQRTDRYHRFDWGRVKLNVVLAVNSLSPSPSPKGEGKAAGTVAAAGTGGDQEWMVKRPEDSEPWPITTAQLAALTDMLSWIDDEKSDKTIFMFPYPEIRVATKSQHTKPAMQSQHTQPLPNGGRMGGGLQGPPPLLDGYTWQEYRWLTDWMQEYMQATNAKRDTTEPMAQFLAVLFKPAGEAAGTVVADMFANFSPVKWQVILFWWSSLMQQLARKFPRVFKQQAVGKKKGRRAAADTPWDFYNRVTATIQKYIGGLSEKDVNAATYGTILQQLEMMANEAAEMEKLKNKK